MPLHKVESPRLTPNGLPAERPTHVLLHLSDTHLTTVGTRYNGVIDADAALARTIDRIRGSVRHGRRVDTIVASGDLTDSGDPDAYRRLRVALESLALPVIYACGNHDVRSVLHEQLLDLPDVPDAVLQVHDVHGLRVVVLDSTVPRSGIGRLDEGHLDELRDVLRTPAEHGTVVVLHHAPLPPPSPLLAHFALDRTSRAALAAALAGTDARIVLAGHHHLGQSGMLGTVPVAVAPSVAIRTDPLGPPGHELTTASSGFNLVDVYPETITVSVIPVDDAGQVFDLDRTACAAVIAAH